MPALLLALALASAPALPGEGDPSATWLTDLQEARAQARRTDRPLLVVLRCEH